MPVRVKRNLWKRMLFWVTRFMFEGQTLRNTNVNRNVVSRKTVLKLPIEFDRRQFCATLRNVSEQFTSAEADYVGRFVVSFYHDKRLQQLLFD
jgi:hypothetical protein